MQFFSLLRRVRRPYTALAPVAAPGLRPIRETPIERITPKGLKTSAAEYELDVIIYATGFDAVTGALTRIDIRGEGGQTFKDKWADGPRTYLGIQSAGFPNLFIANSAAFCNFPRCAEMVVEWVSECIRYMREKDFARIAATPQAEEAWTEHANELAAGTLLTQANSWFVGANIPGKKRTFLYANSAPASPKTSFLLSSSQLRKRVRKASCSGV